jgi:two-component system nitrogen regulation sensor histidine kinase NtrY
VSLRQKMLLMFSLTVVLAVAAVAWTVSARVRLLFEDLDRARTTALVNQFLHEYQRRSDDVARRVDRMVKDERVTRMAYDLAHGGDAALYLTEAGSLAQEYQLDYLELVQSNGSIVSSAQSPAHFGYNEPVIAAAGQPLFLKEEISDSERSETGLFVVRVVPGAESALYIVAGEKLDSAFLSNLSAPVGSTLYLYRNSTAAFSANNLIGSGGGAINAMGYQDVIDRARSTGLQTNPPVAMKDQDGESFDLTAIPLKGSDGSVMAVLLVANSRRELMEVQQHIRTTAYGVEVVWILLAIIVSLWIAARV